ncbi:hypothetical protein POSPLADRAFT_1057709 [Postia placenta MAD-698-R-SB12]|uniref:Retrovirus-related Pol polyprotein from transposon TNT 1-94-like beta-barrel domain-containing protein n=1 Tax=Postia placenta MAD-698-R-SB12 TaxID=670580 RepID=A0A1X6MX19_9APHY|nr:hypothetical protein POSPLADRAFT_1057709 [Postia placenta MAD-698-R-SB12]OSX60780.1 hypothetical protein POSPLADRAFT_1057709 [Postia placenta MAD-698-R-SB12]
MSNHSSSLSFPKLNASNYKSWAGDMAACLRSAGLWRLVSGAHLKPQAKDPKALTEAEATLLEKWEVEEAKAAGWLYLMVEADQKVHFSNIDSNPVAMWAALKGVHQRPHAAGRWNAWEALLSIRKSDSESLQAVINRVEDAMQQCKNLRPDKYTLDELDSELTVMAMILALPREDFALLRTQLLNGDLKKATVIQAFVTEDAQRRHDSTIASQSALAVASSSSGPCDFCGASGHSQPQCYSFQKAQKQAKERRTTRGKGKAATAQEKPAEPAQESAANASALSSHSLEPSSPSTPLQLDADFTWNADTGATSHMTPHRHWLRNYKPLRLPVKLADNKVVYSAGVGSVVFRPRVKGAFQSPVLSSSCTQ